MERKAHFTAFQEHAMEDKEIHIFKGIMAKKGINMLGLDPQTPNMPKNREG